MPRGQIRRHCGKGQPQLVERPARGSPLEKPLKTLARNHAGMRHPLRSRSLQRVSSADADSAASTPAAKSAPTIEAALVPARSPHRDPASTSTSSTPRGRCPRRAAGEPGRYRGCSLLLSYGDYRSIFAHEEKIAGGGGRARPAGHLPDDAGRCLRVLEARTAVRRRYVAAVPPDLVLMDIQMPGMSGDAAIREILGVDRWQNHCGDRVSLHVRAARRAVLSKASARPNSFPP